MFRSTWRSLSHPGQVDARRFRPAFQNRQVTTPVNEGSLATVTGHITEPDATDTFFLEMTWGDGSPTETFRFAPGTPRDISVSHRYLDDRPSATPEDTYTIQMFWHDEHGLGNRGLLDVTIRSVPPEVFAGGDDEVGEGKQFKRIGLFVDLGHDSWTATVDYGDGAGPQTLDLRHNNKFELKHKYDAPGVYHVVIAIMDDDGGIGLASFEVTVLEKGKH